MTDKKIIIDCQYLAPISYYALCMHAKEVHIESHEYFVKSSNRNRSYIAGPNGIQMLSIPIHHGKSHKQLMRDVITSPVEQWQKSHWQSICSAYRRSPYFEFYEDALFPYYHQKIESLFEFNMALFHKISDLLKLQIDIHFTGMYKAEYSELLDYRYLYKEVKYEPDIPEYSQVFSDRHEFLNDMSIIDLMFNLGPDAKTYISNLESLLEFPLSH